MISWCRSWVHGIRPNWLKPNVVAYPCSLRNWLIRLRPIIVLDSHMYMCFAKRVNGHSLKNMVDREIDIQVKVWLGFLDNEYVITSLYDGLQRNQKYSHSYCNCLQYWSCPSHWFLFIFQHEVNNFFYHVYFEFNRSYLACILCNYKHILMTKPTRTGEMNGLVMCNGLLAITWLTS